MTYSHALRLPRILQVARTVVPASQLPAPWSDSIVDLDFVNGIYWNGSSISRDPSAFYTFSRTASATDLIYTDPIGHVLHTFGSGVPRIDPDNDALLIEGPRTNFLLNSGAPATQTTGSLSTSPNPVYILWVNGSGSATSSAGTATGTGFGAATQGSPNIFSLTGAGTVVVTVSGSLNQFQLEQAPVGTVTDVNPTSFIQTTGATASRDADVFTSGSGSDNGLIDSVWRGPSGAVVIEFFTQLRSTTNQITARFLDDANSVAEIETDSAIGSEGTITLTRNFPTNVARTANTFTTATRQRIGVSWGGGLSIVLNGGAVATAVEGDAVMAGPTSIGNQTNAAKLRSLQGALRRLTMWNSKLSDSRLQSLTAL